MTPGRLSLALVFLASSLAAQTTYYVSQTGSDTNAGTSREKAWRSIARVNTGSYVAGDRILFEGGRTFNGTLRFNAANLRATTAAPVTISSYGPTPATIASGDEEALIATAAGPMTVSSLRFIGTSFANKVFYKSGLVFTNTTDTKVLGLTIDRVHVEGYHFAGISLTGSNRLDGYGDVRIEFSTLRELGYIGIALAGNEQGTFNGVEIGNNEISLVRGYLNLYGLTVEGSGSGISLSGVFDGLVHHNAIHDNGEAGGGPQGIALGLSREVRLRENEIYRVHSAATINGAAIDFTGSNISTSAEFNYTHDNDGPALRIVGTQRDVLVAYNVSENDGGRGSAGAVELAEGEIDGATLLHNTFYNDTTTGALISVTGNPASYRLVRFVNNLFAVSGVTLLDVDDPSNTSELLFAGNNWYSYSGPPRFIWGAQTFDSLGDWSAGTGHEQFGGASVGHSTDPLLLSAGGGGTIWPRSLNDLDAYRLDPTSPVADVGMEPSTVGLSPGPRDFFGYPFSRDIGAHQAHRQTFAPSIDPIDDQRLEAGDVRQVTVVASDPDGATGLHIALITAPSFATLTRTTGGRAVITLAPTTRTTNPATITLRVEDESGTTADETFLVTVTGPTPPPPPPPLVPRPRATRRH